MEAVVASICPSQPTWTNSDEFANKLRFSRGLSGNLRQQSQRVSFRRRRLVSLEVHYACKDSQASVKESEGFHNAVDESSLLESRSKKVEPYLNGRCIYLVGMMGSGKTTVGRILSQALGYAFFDCDTLVEQAVDGTPVADIFKVYGERFFREKETEALKNISSMHQLVVSTGGGAVIRPINWEYMHRGISVWLDVPLEALARRIAAVGTGSRPLLHDESGDAYTQSFRRLTTLWDERGESYTNASARVSLENIAAKLGIFDVCNLTPTVIAIEALEQIEKYLLKEKSVV